MGEMSLLAVPLLASVISDLIRVIISIVQGERLREALPSQNLLLYGYFPKGGGVGGGLQPESKSVDVVFGGLFFGQFGGGGWWLNKLQKL